MNHEAQIRQRLLPRASPALGHLAHYRIFRDRDRGCAHRLNGRAGSCHG